MSYRPLRVSQNPRYSFDRHEVTGQPVLSLPVRNQMCEYEEWYSISEQELEQFLADEKLALDFVSLCSTRRMDDRLVLKPGSDRGHYTG